jgi:glycosyltransferase involved in cell wall biosynthesis
MKVLFILTYYRPHVSGLTIYVERLARALAQRGHQVTVLTSQYDGRLAREELLDGVRVLRVPVAFRFNKGVVMPAFALQAWREIRAHDVVSIHLPQVEAAPATVLTRLAGRKPLLTYHCDLQMPPVWYGRFVADYLINAIPSILAEIPDLHILFAGPYKDVIGETIWYNLQPLIKQYESYLTFLGSLNPNQMADFFALCDVVTVASINNTESFGLVQVEAFMCGTPVVATDLPGVRQPVTMTGMGEIVPIADAGMLAAGIVKVLKDPDRYIKPRQEILSRFDITRTVDEYEQLFEEKRN